MKLKTFAVITLVVLGSSFASAQDLRKFYFWETGTDELYCDFVVISYDSGGVVAGYDDTTLCDFAVNSSVVGFDATLPKDGLPVHGKGIVVGDAIYDATCSCYSGLQWTLWVSDNYSKVRDGMGYGPSTWMGVAGSYTGTYFGDNYGWTTPTSTPSKIKVAGHRTTAGALPAKLRK